MTVAPRGLQQPGMQLYAYGTDHTQKCVRGSCRLGNALYVIDKMPLYGFTHIAQRIRPIVGIEWLNLQGSSPRR